MELDEIRELLFKNMDDQLAADTAAAETNQRLGQQRLMYSNEARGTLYSGQPTWERAQLAAQGVADIADINSKYLNQRLKIWDNITNTLDQINSYNKAAAAMAQAANNVATTTTSGQSFLELYNKLQGGE